MKKILLITEILIMIGSFVHAQENKKEQPTYKSAIGVRFFPLGVTFKSNIAYRKTSFEIIAYFKDGFTGTYLHEWNFTINTKGNIRGYAGIGGNVGFKNEKNGGGAVLGASGVLGLDYKFLHLPLNLSLDWQTTLQFGKSNDFKGWGGIGVRFTL